MPWQPRQLRPGERVPPRPSLAEAFEIARFRKEKRLVD